MQRGCHVANELVIFESPDNVNAGSNRCATSRGPIPSLFLKAFPSGSG